MIKTGKIKIESIIDKTRFVGPDRSETDLEVTYLTGKGYRGTVTVAKEGATEKKIWAAVIQDSKVVESVLTTEKEV